MVPQGEQGSELFRPPRGARSRSSCALSSLVLVPERQFLTNDFLQALALQPNDLGIIFNIAIIEQKGVEILFELPPDRRTLADLNIALADGEDSLRCVPARSPLLPRLLTLRFGRLFEQLANDKSPATPYDRGLPGHRLRYGQGLSRRAPDVLAGQEAYEATEAAKVDRAKQARDVERQRLADAEAQRLEEIAKQARVLAEERRAMGESHSAYLSSRTVVESDDEDKKRKSGGKKRKTKGKKEDKEDGGSSEDEGEKPKPKKKKVSFAFGIGLGVGLS